MREVVGEVYLYIFLLQSNEWIAASEDDVYPDRCAGWIYILNPTTAAALVEAAQKVPFLWIDDAWVTGYLARYLNITHQDISKYWIESSNHLLFHKSAQSPAFYHPDIISGPNDRNMILSVDLHEKARWRHLISGISLKLVIFLDGVTWTDVKIMFTS